MWNNSTLSNNGLRSAPAIRSGNLFLSLLSSLSSLSLSSLLFLLSPFSLLFFLSLFYLFCLPLLFSSPPSLSLSALGCNNENTNLVSAGRDIIPRANRFLDFYKPRGALTHALSFHPFHPLSLSLSRTPFANPIIFFFFGVICKYNFRFILSSTIFSYIKINLKIHQVLNSFLLIILNSFLPKELSSLVICDTCPRQYINIV